MILTHKRLLVDIFLTRRLSIENNPHFASLQALIASPDHEFALNQD